MERPTKFIKAQHTTTQPKSRNITNFYAFIWNYKPAPSQIIWAAELAMKVMKKNVAVRKATEMTFFLLKKIAGGQTNLDTKTLGDLQNLVSKCVATMPRFFDEDFTLRLPKEILAIILTYAWEYKCGIASVCKRWREILNRPESKMILLKTLDIPSQVNYMLDLKSALILKGLFTGDLDYVSVEMKIKNHGQKEEKIYGLVWHQEKKKKHGGTRKAHFVLVVEPEEEEITDCWLFSQYASTLTSYCTGDGERRYKFEASQMRDFLVHFMKKNGTVKMEYGSKEPIWKKISDCDVLLETIKNDQETHKTLVKMARDYM